MQQEHIPVVRAVAAPPMPPVIAKAVLEAISKIEGTEATGKGEDADTNRKFTYTSINDVLNAGHKVLIEVGLTAMPIEVEYHDELVTSPLNAQHILARYAYQFRIIHKDGTSWVDERDTRHVALFLSVDGKGAGKAQSLALRDYYKGLLRIRTIEPDEDTEQLNGVEKQKKKGRETSRIPPKNGILFDFGKGMESLTAQEVEAKFKELLGKQSFEVRQQWEGANATGLRALYEHERPVWLRLRREIERE